MGDHGVGLGLEPRQLPEGLNHLAGDLLRRRVHVVRGPFRPGVQHPPLPGILAARLAGIVGDPIEHRMLDPHSFMPGPGRLDKMGRDRPARQDPLYRVVQVAGQVRQITLCHQRPGLGRRGGDDHLVKRLVPVADGVDERPLAAFTL